MFNKTSYNNSEIISLLSRFFLHIEVVYHGHSCLCHISDSVLVEYPVISPSCLDVSILLKVYQNHYQDLMLDIEEEGFAFKMLGAFNYRHGLFTFIDLRCNYFKTH